MADATFCEDPGMIYRLIQSFRHDVDLRGTLDPFRSPPLITSKTVLVVPVFQGVDPTLALSMTHLTVFAVDDDTIAKPEFHVRSLFDAVSGDLPGAYHSISRHHFAFIVLFPKWITDQENIPVAKDPEGFDWAAFLKKVNAGIVSAFTQN